VFSKILEKVFYNRILNYLNKNEILYANQYGFRKGHSIASALLDLYDKISEAIDKREVAVGVFLDLSAKAFDTVNHNILFEKLECILVYVA
jgi:retron-type reverse transcriptase